MAPRPFIKMHGLGNDFVIFDARKQPLALSDAAARAIADRKEGVGCDQLIVMEPPQAADADVFMRIRNADGGEVEACGNAARCVASLVIDERKSPITIESVVGLLPAEKADQNRYSVDMGPVGTDWQSIPLAGPQDTLHMDLTLGPLSDPVAVSVGNPHAVFFVPDSEAVPLADLGPALEHHALFPERANISVATVVGPNRLRQRVWERGVGITRACGTGACAAAAAANRRGLTGREVEIALDGGILEIFWHENGHVIMTGPVATAFSGEIHL